MTFFDNFCYRDTFCGTPNGRGTRVGHVPKSHIDAQYICQIRQWDTWDSKKNIHYIENKKLCRNVDLIFFAHTRNKHVSHVSHGIFLPKSLYYWDSLVDRQRDTDVSRRVPLYRQKAYTETEVI